MADNITHGLAAALLAQAGFRQRYGPIATFALVIGSELPDLDALYRLAGPVTSFINHRGITHSFVGGAALALLAGVMLWLLRRQTTYWRITGMVYLGILLHLGMDYLTSYGTQLLLPFDAGHYAADAVFIVDYCYTAIMLVGLLLVRMVRQQRQQRYLVLGLTWVLFGSGLWLAAPQLAYHIPELHSQIQAGWWLILGAMLLRVLLGLLPYLRPQWSAPPGTIGLAWLLLGLGAWLLTPRFVQPPLLLMARHEASVYIVSGAALLALLAWIGRRWQAWHTVVVGRCAVATLVAYVGLCLVNQALARQHMAQALGPQMAAVQRLSALAAPGGGAWHWRVIAETQTEYLSSLVSLYSAVTPPQRLAKGLENRLVQTTKPYRLVQIFLDFARFPVIEAATQGTETVVRYSDLRFRDGRGRSWFDLTVHVDHDGAVQGIEFLNRLFLPDHPEFAARSNVP
jgi:membrane-bound metal-dependent hydrolase YbcI (DUF457 family)